MAGAKNNCRTNLVNWIIMEVDKIVKLGERGIVREINNIGRVKSLKTINGSLVGLEVGNMIGNGIFTCW